MSGKRSIQVARVYDEAAKEAPGDVTRVLVDRLWPRGMRKDDAPVDEWLKEIAPSTDLRRWYGHEPSRREEFHHRYLDELAQTEGPRADALARLRDLVATGPVMLLTSTKVIDSSHLPLLADLLTR